MKVRKQAASGVDSGGSGFDGHEAVDKDLGELMAAVQKAVDERNQIQDQLLRTMADFQNFRKRQEEQRKVLEQFATERLVRALLPVLDSLERAIGSLDSQASADSLAEGLRAVDRQFRQVLEGHGVTRISSVGTPFNPEVHEALATEASDEHEDNTVIGEVEAGYRMADRVIRPARVRVSRKEQGLLGG